MKCLMKVLTMTGMPQKEGDMTKTSDLRFLGRLSVISGFAVFVITKFNADRDPDGAIAVLFIDTAVRALEKRGD